MPEPRDEGETTKPGEAGQGGDGTPAADASPRDLISAGAYQASLVCIEHADDLLRAAQLLLKNGEPHLAFHFGALALEEVGKSVLVRIADYRGDSGDAEWRAGAHMDDHVQKLYWAIWTPSIGQQTVNRASLEKHRTFARQLHERRQQALYVSPIGDKTKRPRDMISQSDTEGLLAFAQERVNEERAFERRELSKEALERLSWFREASDDPLKERFIFGKESMEKLAAVQGPAWIEWLHQRITAADAEANALLERELRREEPKGDAAHEPKWRFRFRFFSDSHSLRPGPLSDWNKGTLWIKFTRAKSNELIVDVTLTKRFHADSLWAAGMEIKRHLMVALSIGSIGLFWWELPRHTSRFYEELTDLESGKPLLVERVPEMRLDWGKQVLDLKTMNGVRLAFAGVFRAESLGLKEALGHYANGLGCFAKTDVHLDFSWLAFRQFFEAFQAALKVRGEWDGKEPLTDAVVRLHVGPAPPLEAIQQYIKLGQRLASGEEVRITLTEVAAMKIMCDMYFLRCFRELLRGAESKAPSGTERPLGGDDGAAREERSLPG